MSDNLLDKGPYPRSPGPIVMPNEPYVTINGMRLTHGQAMTVRVAIESFASDLIERGLGNDELGISIKERYLQSINDIRFAMYEVNPHG